MNNPNTEFISRAVRLATSLLGGLLAVAAILFFMGKQTMFNVQAAPVPPPDGYPKLSLSTKVVTPTLAGEDGATLEYIIEIINTGAYTAEDVTLVDEIPNHTTFTGKAGASVAPVPSFADGILTWGGTVGFDTAVVITFSVDVTSNYAGIISNTAVISQPQISKPVTVTAETTITDNPILVVKKSALPAKPGANKALVYEIEVTNQGQPATNLPVTVVDEVPQNTSLLNIGLDGSANSEETVVTWTRPVSLAFQESSVFTFSVTIDDVLSGTVINNADYYVESAQTGVTAGEAYSVTVIDPILYISKDVWPHPPGSNREMTYTLTVLNKGSLATDLTISDVVPDEVTYLRGGSNVDGTVSWDYPSLDTGESTQFTYTVYIDDIAEVDILNQTYEVCSAEDVCSAGEVLTSVVQGPSFEAEAELDPIAKKPGGGGGPVTPTLTVKNLGPGNALDAVATLYFERISVSLNDLVPKDSFVPGPDCGDKCSSYVWVGNIGYGETITFTTIEGQSTIGGEEGTNYTATVVISDSLGTYTTEPITATAIGTITHYANLIPMKSGPTVVGAGEMMTYTIQVWNSGLSTDTPPFPVLVETLPVSVTFVATSDGGVEQTVNDHTVISWTLPSLGPGDRINRSFSVLVNDGLAEGMEIINDDYHTLWYEEEITGTGYISKTGEPYTTVVKEVGLVDSFKRVTPELARPGPTNVLTYVVHVVNSSPTDLQDVQVHDMLPWENSTYQRDAVTSNGEVISDIVSIDWIGDVAALSSERITFTVLVDPDFEGAITNTALIQHPSLIEDVLVDAVAYITNDPVLQITKSASPDPVRLDDELLYTIEVVNLGQQATNLEIWDTLPDNTSYVAGSASAGGKLVSNQVHWQLPVLLPGEKQILNFRVMVVAGNQVINRDYWVTCAEGVTAAGKPVTTVVVRQTSKIFLPIVYR